MFDKNLSPSENYKKNIQKMVQWRTAEAICAWLLIALVPLLSFLEVDYQYYTVIYAGFLISLLFCNHRRVLYRNIAKHIFDSN